MRNNKSRQISRRKRRIRGKIFGTKDKPRLSVFRSNNHISAQIIDDEKGATLIAAGDNEMVLSVKKSKSPESKTQGSYESRKMKIAFEVGSLLAKKAGKKKIKKIVFDRGAYKYHGRVAALAKGARKGGLKF